MLHHFLRANAPELIDRCRIKAAQRRASCPPPLGLEHGIPRFLEQLAEMLAEASAHSVEIRPISQDPASPAESRIRDSAKMHGLELLRHDFSIEQVVHDYGDLCQAITEMAFEKEVLITVREFGVLNIRLDNAIAGAVAEYARQRESSRAEQVAPAAKLAYEMRNLLNTAILAVSAIRAGSVGFGGATAAALDRSLVSARSLADSAITEFDGGPDASDVNPASSSERRQPGHCAPARKSSPSMA
jgi:hypothetical protein